MERQKMDAQFAREMQLVPGMKTCPAKGGFDPNDITDLMSQGKLEEFLQLDFYQAGVMQALFCAFDTNITVANPTNFNANEKVRQFFTSLRQIGADSVEGYALFASFKDVNDLFVIKVPRDPANDNLFHEYFVGLVLNYLRQYIPNFSYVFGAFRCLPPQIGEDKNVSEWCGTGPNTVNYVIFEKVTGPSLKESIIGCNFQQFFSYIVQIIMALEIAAISTDFTHYDLHNENVILREVKSKSMFYVPYTGSSGKTYFVYTDRVPTFIDYGRCHVKVGEEHFGFHSNIQGVFADRSRSMHDIYKIITFSLFEMYLVKNWDCLSEAINLARMFPSDFGTEQEPQWNEIQNIDQLIVKLILEREAYFEIGDMTELESRKENNYDNVLKAMKRDYPKEWNSVVTTEIPKGQPILDCISMKCKTPQAVVQALSK